MYVFSILSNMRFIWNMALEAISFRGIGKERRLSIRNTIRRVAYMLGLLVVLFLETSYCGIQYTIR